MGIITNKIYICLPNEKEIDKLDWNGLSTEEYNGKTYYKIPSGGHSSDVVKKITFETLYDNVTVTLYIVSSSEQSFAYAYACDLDSTSGYSNAKYKISGDNKSITCKYVVPNKGSHWIYIGYRKDGSGNQYNDCGYFSIDAIDKEYVIRQPKEVYLDSNKMNEITYGSKKIFEYGLGNTISWDTLEWNKSTDKYTYNTNGPINFNYYIGNSYNDVVLQKSPKPLPRNDFDGLYFRDVITYIGTSYTKLYKLDLSDWDTSNVTNMKNIFARCSSLSYLNISGWDTSNVTSMSNMFLICEKLPSLDVSHFNTSNVKDMDNMFYNLNIDSLDVSNFNTSKVTNMNYMFYGCRKLTYLDVSHFNTNNVLTMNNMFNYCRLLKSLNVSNFNTSKVTTMEGMFKNCESLVSLDLSNFDTSKVTNMEGMFQYCKSLVSLDLSNFDTSKVTKMNYMFNGCSKLTSLDVSKWNVGNVTDMYSMFGSCSALTSLDVSKWNVANVTNMNYMFSSCRALTSLDVSNWNVSSVNGMTFMFGGCRALTSLDVSNWNVSSVAIMSYIFYRCSALTSLDVSNWNVSSVTNMDYMFDSCSALTSLIDGHESDPNVVALNGLKVNLDLRHSTKLNYESVYALFRGVATVTSTKTITLPKVMEGKLDAAKIKIATDKGWTVAYK